MVDSSHDAAAYAKPASLRLCIWEKLHSMKELAILRTPYVDVAVNI